ncbi:MAG: beta-galactosidase trimerization domain-containing protein [Verrucomicrobiota bacterium JB024]|nr:beta-galactosidase trimerization domain-containing protein [Verrucomicrobiota bacterium JB024]
MQQTHDRFRLGVNYWPQSSAINMWKAFSPEEIESDFQAMKASGLDTVRIFPTWDDFQPMRVYRGHRKEFKYVGMKADCTIREHHNPSMVDPEMIRRLDTVVDIARRHELDLMIALITGWMSGGMMLPTYYEGQNLYTDPFMLKWQHRLVSYFAERYKDEPRVVAWGLGNECNCLDETPSAEAAWLWTSTICDAVRTRDASRPIVSGMHSIGPLAGKNRWRLQDQAELCDVLTTHPYPLFTPGCNIDGPSDMRPIMHAAAESALYRGLGKRPVLCEETGTLGASIFSDELSGIFLRQRLHSLLQEDVTGCLWWCFTDFDQPGHWPYNYALKESSLGIFDRQGRPKPPADEYKRFSQVLKAIGGKLPPKTAQAAILVPAEAGDWRPYFNAYLLCRQAGIHADFVWEYDDLSAYRLVIAPALAENTIYHEGWQNLQDYAAGGGCVYFSYDGLDAGDINAFAGIRVQHRKSRQPKGPIVTPAGELTYAEEHAPLDLDFTLDTAKVCFSYADGKPALVRNTFGQGQVFFMADPIEKMLGMMPRAYATDASYQLYAHLGTAAGIQPPCRNATPGVLTSYHQAPSSSEAFVTAINFTGAAIQERLVLTNRAARVTSLNDQVQARLDADGSLLLDLPANESVVCRLER